MPTYAVRPGVTFGKDNQYIPGDEVELSEAEAKPFLDKLAFVWNDVDVVFVDAGNAVSESSSSDIVSFGDLPDRAIRALVKAGVTPDMLSLMTDDEIVEIEDVGLSALAKIRKLYPKM